jgi:hypothetical protein
MRDLEVRPLDGPDGHPFGRAGGFASADRGGEVTFGGPAGRRSGDRNQDRHATWWAGVLRRLPVIRSLVGRPVSPWLAASVSAALAGGAVAFLLDRPGEVGGPAPVPTVAVLEPESWLQVDDFNDDPREWLGDDRMRRELAEAARHPERAVVVLPVNLVRSGLAAVPAGVYDVRVSCTPVGSEPFRVQVGVNEPPLRDLRLTVPCDGDIHLVEREVAVRDGFTAFTSYWFPAGPPGDDGHLGGPHDAMVAISLTPVGGPG